MKKRKEKNNDKFSFKIMFNRFTKIIVILTMIYSMALTTISYIWSYLGKDPLVNLSSTIISTLVAPVMTYLITNCIQCLFEYNQLAFSTPIAAIQSGVITQQNITQTSTPTPISPDNPMDLDLTNDFEMETSSGKGDDE